MNVEINRECARLESLLHSRPNETARKEVEDALRSKWEGVQVWAGRVLAAWGGRRSIDALRGWLEVSLSKEAGWAIRGEAVRSLCQCYEPRDVPWLLDLYFSAADRLLRHEFSPVILALPEDVVRERIALEARSQIKPDEKQLPLQRACLIRGSGPFTTPPRRAVIRRVIANPGLHGRSGLVLLVGESHTPQQLRNYRAKRRVSWQHSTAASTVGCTPPATNTVHPSKPTGTAATSPASRTSRANFFRVQALGRRPGAVALATAPASVEDGLIEVGPGQHDARDRPPSEVGGHAAIHLRSVIASAALFGHV